MDRYERGQFFEALLGLRNAYANRSDDDRRAVLSSTDVIIYADAVMTALEAEDAEANANATVEANAAAPEQSTPLGDTSAG
jgi:hypothetical protein